MKVILDVNRPSFISGFVQSCSSVEGFLEIQRMHPEDEFSVDCDSALAYVDYMESMWVTVFLEFCDEMHCSKADYDAMVDFYQNVEPSPDPVHDEAAFLDELYADDYYLELLDDYYATLRDAMPNCWD